MFHLREHFRCERSDGVLAYVEPSEAVTPVSRDTLDGTQIISSSST